MKQTRVSRVIIWDTNHYTNRVLLKLKIHGFGFVNKICLKLFFQSSLLKLLKITKLFVIGTGKSFIARKLMSHLLSEKLSSDSSEQQDKRKKNTNGGGDSNGPSTTRSLNMDLDDISDLRKTVKDILNSW